MGDFRKVKSGDPLVIPAATYNAFIDAAVAHRGIIPGTRGARGAAQANGTLVLVQNTDGGSVDRFAAMEVFESVVQPAGSSSGTGNDDNFLNQIVLKVKKPTVKGLGNWVVLQEPLPTNGIGYATCDGLTIAKINLTGKHHATCEVADANTVPQSSAHGTAQIVWVAGGVSTATEVGEQFAVLRLKANPVVWMDIQITGATALPPTNSNRWSYAWKEVEATKGGRFADVAGGWTNATAGPAFNTLEANNSATGTQGNGINVSTLAAGFTIQPAASSAVVRAWRVPNCEDPSTVEWHFTYANAVQGACP